MNKTREYNFTIVVPVYNEEDNLDRVEKSLSHYLTICTLSACVLLVNDGSRDSSLEKIKAICGRQPDFFYISSSANHGLSTATQKQASTRRSQIFGVYRR